MVREGGMEGELETRSRGRGICWVVCVGEVV